MCKEVVEGCGSGRHRLLVLVGDGDLAGSIVHWSAHAGLEVDAVESGTQAARLLRKHRYRALVTDRVIPPWPGLNSLPKLKRQFPDLRVIVFLRRGPVGAGSLLRLAGADDVIEGPIRRATLMSALRLETIGGSRSATGR